MLNFIAKIFICILVSQHMAIAAGKKDGDSHEHRAHSHGNGTLELAIDGKSVKGKFELPMESLLGFENLPKNASQKKTMAALQEATQTIENFIQLPASAGCVSKSISATSDMFLGKKSDHSDLDLSFEWECKKISEVKQIDLVIFKNYRKLKSMKVDLVTPQSQQSFQVKSNKPTINF